ncbi:MAG: LysR family transcriptional regulator [bacterium]|nr:LysR family transcriptional regulator [bacterium]
MQSIQGFEEFFTIIDCGRVTAAADVLGLPRPTVSRRLARLEQRLGVRLLHRTTRRMKITPQGEVLYARARRTVEADREFLDPKIRAFIDFFVERVEASRR